MNPLLLKYIVEELRDGLVGGIVSKVYQPDERHVILRVFAKGRERTLLISIHPVLCRIHLTGLRFRNPSIPPRFCALLRSRIINAIVHRIEQVDDERIVRVYLRKKTDGGIKTFVFVVELTGKSANVILVDGEEKVIDALRYFPEEDSPRCVKPGVKLKPLPGCRPETRGDIPEKEEGVSWNECVDRYYTEKVEKESFEAKRRELLRRIRKIEKKVRRKLQNLLKDREDATTGTSAKRLAELLLANFPRIRKGMKEIEVEDYYTSPPERIRIPLDESLTPQENVDRLFKRARKAKVCLDMLNKRIPYVEQELEYIDNLLYELESATTHGDLDTIEDELILAGYIKRDGMGKDLLKREDKRAEPVRRFTTQQGLQVLCGRSAVGNDLLLRRYAGRNDLWFHAKGVPGSHVLLKTGGRRMEDILPSIEEASRIAAYYSRAREETKVEVMYTPVSNVKKPPGAKPGMVVVGEGYRTIIVRPRNDE